MLFADSLVARAGKESFSLSMGITLGETGDITDVIVTPALVKVGGVGWLLLSLSLLLLPPDVVVDLGLVVFEASVVRGRALCILSCPV